MSETTVSTAERVGTILLAATVGAIVTTLVAHPLIESALADEWQAAGGSSSVEFRAQEVFLPAGEYPAETEELLKTLPVTSVVYDPLAVIASGADE
ncbi:hypothetical protein OAF27_02055 [Verrucomicrobiales bacterium]|nr:hypothetical protein [Verrucomicrobiales bacterium]